MYKSRKLSATAAAVMAVVMMTGTSAFADSRHRVETNGSGPNGQTRSDRNGNSNFNDRGNRQNGDRNGQQGNSTYDNRNGQGNSKYGDRNGHQGNSTYDNRGGRQGDSTYGNRNDRQGNSTYDNRNGRQNNSGYDYRNNNDRRGNSNYGYQNETRRSERFEGRVSSYERYRGGYRVWVGGTRYPFFISADRWARSPLRVGVSVVLGGYWDPAGYYDVYDVGPYATSGNLHGVVESVDYRRGTLVLRDDVSGSFVTAVMRGRDPRLGNLRTGDYVELSGAWNRNGVFDAYNVSDLGSGGYGRQSDPRYGY